jgi:hypothetical protein
MIKHATAILLCLALVTTGCASARGARMSQSTPQAPPSTTDPALLADYLQRLPAGSRVKVERSNGTMIKGTLMKASGDNIVVQKNTRVPEAAVRIPLSDISRVTPDEGGHSRAVHIWAGVGIAFTSLFVLSLILTAAAGGA